MSEARNERVIFSVDWPFQPNRDGRAFLDSAPISERERAMIYGDNVRQLLRL